MNSKKYQRFAITTGKVSSHWADKVVSSDALFVRNQVSPNSDIEFYCYLPELVSYSIPKKINERVIACFFPIESKNGLFSIQVYGKVVSVDRNTVDLPIDHFARGRFAPLFLSRNRKGVSQIYNVCKIILDKSVQRYSCNADEMRLNQLLVSFDKRLRFEAGYRFLKHG